MSIALYDHSDIPGRDLRELIKRQADQLYYNGTTFVARNAANAAAVAARTMTETVVVAEVESLYTPPVFPIIGAGIYEVSVYDNGVSAVLASGLYYFDGTTLYPSPAQIAGVTESGASGIANALAGGNINVYAPAAGANLDLYRGDSYQNADGRAITVSKLTSETSWPTTLSTVDFYCKPTQQTLDTYASAASLGPISCTVTQATGSSQAFRLDLTSAQLATLQAAVQTPANGYTYWIVANRATNPATLRTGPLNVRPDYSAT